MKCRKQAVLTELTLLREQKTLQARLGQLIAEVWRVRDHRMWHTRISQELWDGPFLQSQLPAVTATAIRSRKAACKAANCSLAA